MGIDVPTRQTLERVATSEPARVSVRIFVVIKEPGHYSSSCGKWGFKFLLPLCRGRWRKNEKIKVIVKHCGRQPCEHKVVPDGRVISKFTPVMIASDLCLLFKKHARVLGYSLNANICGVDFYGTVIFAGRNGDKLTDVPVDLNKFKILFPDLFLEE